jgi:conjugative transfer pilus assembly protein TraH
VDPVGPCPENKLDFNLILEGKAQAKSIAGECNDIPDTNKKLQQYVSDRMLTITASIKTGDALDEDDQEFINSIALPLHSIMKMAVGTQQEGAIVSLLADVTAKAYAYQLLSDLFHMSFHLLTKGELLIRKQADQPREDSDPEQCTLAFFEPAKKEISRMKNDLFSLLQSARSAYSTAASEVNAILVLVEKMHTFNAIAYNQISQSFGQDVARRLNVKSD